MSSKARIIMERRGKIEQLDRTFDLKFWQAQTDTARFEAAWELVVTAYKIKGQDISQLRLQRFVETFQRLPDVDSADRDATNTEAS